MWSVMQPCFISKGERHVIQQSILICYESSKLFNHRLHSTVNVAATIVVPMNNIQMWLNAFHHCMPRPPIKFLARTLSRVTQWYQETASMSWILIGKIPTIVYRQQHRKCFSNWVTFASFTDGRLIYQHWLSDISRQLVIVKLRDVITCRLLR